MTSLHVICGLAPPQSKILATPMAPGPLTDYKGAPGPLSNNQGAQGPLTDNQGAQGPLTDNQGPRLTTKGPGPGAS